MDKDNLEVWDKASENYFEDIISPFAQGVRNPIYWYIENKIPNSKNKSVIDIGTGVGNILPFLSERFVKVVGIDISKKMIEMAKTRVTDMKNVELFVADSRDLSQFYNTFDVVIAVNSVLSPNTKDVKKMLSEIFNVLKDDGVFLGIFPSMDAILQQMMLLHEKEAEMSDDAEALKRLKRTVSVNKCDFILGTYEYDDIIQKNYYRFELKYRLQKSGFKNIILRKVSYPWEEYSLELFCKNKNIELKDRPKLWDWFVFAEKGKKMV